MPKSYKVTISHEADNGLSIIALWDEDNSPMPVPSAAASTWFTNAEKERIETSVFDSSLPKARTMAMADIQHSMLELSAKLRRLEVLDEMIANKDTDHAL